MSKAQARNLQDDVAGIDNIQKKFAHKPQKFQAREPIQKFGCRRCATRHGPRECPAYGKKYKKCGKLNHFAVSCKVKKVKKIVEQTTEETLLEESYITIDTVEIDKMNTSWFEKVQIENQIEQFKLNTGAEVNVISLNMLKKLKCRRINYMIPI